MWGFHFPAFTWNLHSTQNILKQHSFVTSDRTTIPAVALPTSKAPGELCLGSVLGVGPGLSPGLSPGSPGSPAAARGPLLGVVLSLCMVGPELSFEPHTVEAELPFVACTKMRVRGAFFLSILTAGAGRRAGAWGSAWYGQESQPFFASAQGTPGWAWKPRTELHRAQPAPRGCSGPVGWS